MSRYLVSFVESVIFYNDKDLEGNWIFMRVDIDSKMMLQASTQGHWRREAKTLVVTSLEGPLSEGILIYP